MMAKRTKFRVGQVICLRSGPLQPHDRYGRVTRMPEPNEKAIQTTDGYWYIPHVRKLTRREKGDASERVVWVIEHREIGETVWTPTHSCLTDKESADKIANLCELPNTEWRAWPYAAKDSAQ